MRVPQYHVAALEKSNRLETEGTQHFEHGKEATEHTDSYVLTSVFFASVLFFAGISMRFVWQKMRVAVLTSDEKCEAGASLSAQVAKVLKGKVDADPLAQAG